MVRTALPRPTHAVLSSTAAFITESNDITNRTLGRYYREMGAFVDQQIADTVEAIGSDIPTPAKQQHLARLGAKRDIIDRRYRQTLVQAQTFTERQQLLAALNGGRTAEDLIENQLSGSKFLKSSLRRLPDAEYAKLVGFTTNNSRYTARAFGMTSSMFDSMNEQLHRGMILGENPKKIAARMQKLVGVAKERAITVSRTATMWAHRAANMDVFRANTDVVAQWKWLSAADKRTCPACWAMHGTVHDVTEDMNGHPRCRCVPVPVTVPWEDLGITGARDTRIDFPDGEELFRRLPPGDQLQVLGPGRYALYNNGTHSLRDFVAVTNHPVWGRGVTTRSLKSMGFDRSPRARAAMRRGDDTFSQGAFGESLKHSNTVMGSGLTSVDDEIAALRTKLATLQDRAARGEISQATLRTQTYKINKQIKDLEAKRVLPPTPDPIPLPPRPVTPGPAYTPEEMERLLVETKSVFLWRGKYSGGERIRDLESAWIDYKNQGYISLNRKLREGVELTREELYQARMLETSFGKTVLNKDAVLYRGLRFDPEDVPLQYRDLRVGSIIEEKGYMSTTARRREAITFTRAKEERIMMEIEAPKGTDYVHLDALLREEGELVLRRGAKMEVLEVEDIWDEDLGGMIKRVRVRIIQHDSPPLPGAGVVPPIPPTPPPTTNKVLNEIDRAIREGENVNLEKIGIKNLGTMSSNERWAIEQKIMGNIPPGGDKGMVTLNLTDDLDFISIQSSVRPEDVRRLVNEGLDITRLDIDPISIRKFNDQYIITEGNHRLVAALARGDKSIRVHLVDFDNLVDDVVEPDNIVALRQRIFILEERFRNGEISEATLRTQKYKLRKMIKDEGYDPDVPFRPVTPRPTPTPTPPPPAPTPPPPVVEEIITDTIPKIADDIKKVDEEIQTVRRLYKQNKMTSMQYDMNMARLNAKREELIEKMKRRVSQPADALNLTIDETLDPLSIEGLKNRRDVLAENIRRRGYVDDADVDEIIAMGTNMRKALTKKYGDDIAMDLDDYEALDKLDRQIELYRESIQKYESMNLPVPKHVSQGMADAMVKKVEIQNRAASSTYDASDVLEMLKSLRSFGGQSKPSLRYAKGAEDLKPYFDDVFDATPTEWLDDMDLYTSSNWRGTFTVGRESRGYFSQGQKKVVISGRGAARTAGTVQHELGHMMEYSRPTIRQMENKFYLRRTTGERLEHMGPGYGVDEVTRRDKFVDKYMGKEYPSGVAFELHSMGAEFLGLNFVGKSLKAVDSSAVRNNFRRLQTDEEMFDWMLGVYAVL